MKKSYSWSSPTVGKGSRVVSVSQELGRRVRLPACQEAEEGTPVLAESRDISGKS